MAHGVYWGVSWYIIIILYQLSPTLKYSEFPLIRPPLIGTMVYVYFAIPWESSNTGWPHFRGPDLMEFAVDFLVVEGLQTHN